jgi:hypothetical protein
MNIPVNLATEDELSEVVLRRLLDHSRRGYAIGKAYGRRGFGYLRTTINAWNRVAQYVPFIVLTDLDQHLCPKELIDDWLSEAIHPNLLLRVAVREVEAWLLADRSNFAKFLNVSEKCIPPAPDRLSDPKAAVIIPRQSRGL